MYHETEILGRLGRDPEQKTLASGTKLCNASVAVSEYWTDKQTGEKKEKTTWYKLTWFGSSAERAAQKLSKGSLIFAKGTIEARAFMGQDGEPRASLEMRVNLWKLAGGTQEGAVGSHEEDVAPPKEIDDIPF